MKVVSYAASRLDAVDTFFAIGTVSSALVIAWAFELTPEGLKRTEDVDGKHPYGSLLLTGNQLYGTTASGGDHGAGTLFVINTDGTGYNRLHSFGSTKHEGTKPIDNVILVNDALYGMTSEGGKYGQGTIFQVPLN